MSYGPAPAAARMPAGGFGGGRPQTQPPLVTVAVCTRNRTTDLADCLESLTRLRYPRLEMLVVDNFGCDDTRDLVEMVGGRYVRATDVQGTAASCLKWPQDEDKLRLFFQTTA